MTTTTLKMIASTRAKKLDHIDTFGILQTGYPYA
jgi:hypothetical protein